MMATGEDFRYREVEGGSPSAVTSFMHKYTDHVVELATSNSVVRGVLLRAFSMLVPPTALFQPAIMLRVMRQRFGATTALKRQLQRNHLTAKSYVTLKRATDSIGKTVGVPL